MTFAKPITLLQDLIVESDKSYLEILEAPGNQQRRSPKRKEDSNTNALAKVNLVMATLKTGDRRIIVSPEGEELLVTILNFKGIVYGGESYEVAADTPDGSKSQTFIIIL